MPLIAGVASAFPRHYYRQEEIAAALKIAEITVKQHVSHVLEKLDVKDRTEAATEALKRGIISG